MADNTGDVVATYEYDVFGAIRSQSGASANHWLFTGEQRDTQSGLYYLRARYYDPGIGRFLTLPHSRAAPGTPIRFDLRSAAVYLGADHGP